MPLYQETFQRTEGQYWLAVRNEELFDASDFITNFRVDFNHQEVSNPGTFGKRIIRRYAGVEQPDLIVAYVGSEVTAASAVAETVFDIFWRAKLAGHNTIEFAGKNFDRPAGQDNPILYGQATVMNVPWFGEFGALDAGELTLPIIQWDVSYVELS